MTQQIERPEVVTDEHLRYLDWLRESGETNMWGATPYLMEMYGELSKQEARTIHSYWMQSFGERHPKGGQS